MQNVIKSFGESGRGISVIVAVIILLLKNYVPDFENLDASQFVTIVITYVVTHGFVAIASYFADVWKSIRVFEAENK